ncbi:MAG: HigA family addiction module antitoxin [Verrucomicrobia bacterium]|nr:HigA family addiction module antitoxin [Verrucomicrobiota bacterium]
MIDSPTTQYLPDTISPPGDTLLDTLEALGMSQAEFAERSGLTEKTISQIINGKAPITETTALGLERVFGTPARFWLARESKYREALARDEEVGLCAEHAPWARRFPYKQMADHGWVATTSVANEKAAHLLRYFAVRDEACWRNLWHRQELAFRRTAKSGNKLEIVSAWLRQGELEAHQMNVPAFNEAAFKDTIHSLRALTTAVNEDFAATIQERCAAAGVRFLTVPELPGLGVYGVTRWLGDTPLIQQSLHQKSHDHFWFTFFHEARHVLQKRKKLIFLESGSGDHEDQEREEDANRFSGNLLIPPAEYATLLASQNFSQAAIRRFADRIGIHSGIVVGRLMRDKILSYTDPTRRLQVKLRWNH